MYEILTPKIEFIFKCDGIYVSVSGAVGKNVLKQLTRAFSKLPPSWKNPGGTHDYRPT
jgi:hypothetical protein